MDEAALEAARQCIAGLREANNPADRWTGHIPFDAMPRSYNPARGYVASANQRIVPPDYKHVIYGAYSQGHRGIRIEQTQLDGMTIRVETAGLPAALQVQAVDVIRRVQFSPDGRLAFVPIFGSGGVGTAMKIMSACSTPSGVELVKASRPEAVFFFTSSSKPGS